MSGETVREFIVRQVMGHLHNEDVNGDSREYRANLIAEAIVYQLGIRDEEMEPGEVQRRLKIVDRVMCQHPSKEHLPREDFTNTYGPWRCLEKGCGFNSGQHADWYEPPLEETP